MHLESSLQITIVMVMILSLKRPCISQNFLIENSFCFFLLAQFVDGSNMTYNILIMSHAMLFLGFAVVIIVP